MKLAIEHYPSGSVVARVFLTANPSVYAPVVVVGVVKWSDGSAAELYRRAITLEPSWRERFVFVVGAAGPGHFSDAPTLRYPVEVNRMRDAIRAGAARSPHRK